MQNEKKPNCALATSKKSIHRLYETSNGTGGTKCSGRETITSGDVIAGFYCPQWRREQPFLLDAAEENVSLKEGNLSRQQGSRS